MKIGIDIDGVIEDLNQFRLDYGIKFCYEHKIPYEVKEEEYYEKEALSISEEQEELFWNEYLEFYATKYLPKTFVKEVIHTLKEKHEIYIITARNEEGLPPETYGQMQDMVKKWLKENQIEYDKLIFTQKGKLSACLENAIDIMVEDSPKNIAEIDGRIPVLCFDNPYNKKVQGKNITRVYSWYDILNKIENS